MTLTIDLPDELARQLKQLAPPEELDRFVTSAISEAMRLRQIEAEDTVADLLLAELDPEAEPVREEAECRAVVEEGLADVAAGRNLISFEEVRRRWAADESRTAESGQP